MTHIDLFAGIGGFSIAAQRAGFDTVLHCEIEPFCQAVLRKHWPETPICNDIHDITTEYLRRLGIGHVRLVTGGFPCQDISAAGKGAGLKGSRSGLWFEMLRVIHACFPDWVVIENSPVLRVRGADKVLEGLESLGYTCWPLVVGSDDAGAPHERKRVFIVAHTLRSGSGSGTERPGWETGADIDRSRQGAELAHANGQRREERLPASLTSESGFACERHHELADTDNPKRRADSSEGRDNQRQLRLHAERAKSTGRSRLRRAFRYSQWRRTEPGMVRDVHGVPARMDRHQFPAGRGAAQHSFEPPRTTKGRMPNRAARIKALGNAVNPEQVYPILQAIADLDMEFRL